MIKTSKGYVMIKIRDAEEKVGQIWLKDAGNSQRWGTVVDLPEPYAKVGYPGYKKGWDVMIPLAPALQFTEGDETFVVVLQSEVKVYDTPEESGQSKF
jgi:hypothetical protein